ncbi:hypothetical protein FXO37_12739 [Capsicum annuum]|nr:hypothetical protein FXO37_12739 [Capsicum annuum]
MVELDVEAGHEDLPCPKIRLRGSPMTLELSILKIWYGISRSGVQPYFMMPPKMGSQPSIFTMTPIIGSEAMTSLDQKMFERLTHLGLPRFSDLVGKDVYDFLKDCHDKFHNLSFLKSYGVAYTTYQLRDRD